MARLLLRPWRRPRTGGPRAVQLVVASSAAAPGARSVDRLGVAAHDERLVDRLLALVLLLDRAQQRGLRGLGAVVLAQVREQVACGPFGPEQARQEPHAGEARSGPPAASQAIPFVPDFRYKSHEEVRHRMARITVEDCLDHVPNRFELVLLAARRATQLPTDPRPLVESDNKEIVSALREIAAGKVRLQYSG